MKTGDQMNTNSIHKSIYKTIIVMMSLTGCLIYSNIGFAQLSPGSGPLGINLKFSSKAITKIISTDDDVNVKVCYSSKNKLCVYTNKDIIDPLTKGKIYLDHNSFMQLSIIDIDDCPEGIYAEGECTDLKKTHTCKLSLDDQSCRNKFKKIRCPNIIDVGDCSNVVDSLNPGGGGPGI
jgi:hypothetical protein